MNKKSGSQRCPYAVCATAIVLSTTFCIYSCTQKDQEPGGYECLAKSRAYLADNNHKEARNLIDSLRNGYPMAFNAREEGILLLDSIEISQAKYDLENATKRLELSDNAINKDSMLFAKEEAEQKIKFYTKKLTHDKKNFKRH